MITGSFCYGDDTICLIYTELPYGTYSASEHLLYNIQVR